MVALMRYGIASLCLAGGTLADTSPVMAKNVELVSMDLRGTVSGGTDRPAPVVTAMIDDHDTAPSKSVVARVDLSDQRMYVYVEGRLTYVWKVSSGLGINGTPTGTYGPEWMVPMWHSREYNNAPMPWAVFFHGGYAVHGTDDLAHLGKAASHGCVRLHPDNAKAFFRLVAQFGKDATLITVVR